MLGRAVQLTFPIQAPGEELITDSCTAQHYLDMCLNHPSTDTGDARADPNLDEIRKMNADHGSYLWGDYVGLKIFPPPDLRLLNLETAVTRTINNPDVPTMKVCRKNGSRCLSCFFGLLFGCHRSSDLLSLYPLSYLLVCVLGYQLPHAF